MKSNLLILKQLGVSILVVTSLAAPPNSYDYASGPSAPGDSLSLDEIQIQWQRYLVYLPWLQGAPGVVGPAGVPGAPGPPGVDGSSAGSYGGYEQIIVGPLEFLATQVLQVQLVQ